MTIESVHQRITELMDERDISIYKLANICNLPHSSLYTMMNRQTMPKLDTLDAICHSLGITLSDFFMKPEDNCPNPQMTEKEALLLEILNSMPDRLIDRVLAYAKGLKDAYQGEKELEKQKKHETAQKIKAKAKAREAEAQKNGGKE